VDELAEVAGYSVPTRVARLEVRVEQLGAAQRETNRTVERIDTRLDSRPSWSVCVIIAGLASTVGILATALLAHVPT
jgi:hypothetical protein